MPYGEQVQVARSDRHRAGGIRSGNPAFCTLGSARMRSGSESFDRVAAPTPLSASVGGFRLTGASGLLVHAPGH